MKQNPVATDSNRSVSGTIQNQEGYAVPDAIVSVSSAQNKVVALDTTDLMGAFTLNGLPQDLAGLTLQVSHPDYQFNPTDLKTIVASNSGTNFPITLGYHDSCCGTIVVQVSSGGTLLHGATVTLSVSGHHVVSTYSNVHGEAIFHHVCEHDYTIDVSAHGYHSGESTITMSHCDTDTVSIALETVQSTPHDSCCSGVLTVTAIDSATGHAIAGATIHIAISGTTHSITADAHGIATFNHLCEGHYTIDVSSDPHYHSAEITESLGCNDTEAVSIYLSPVSQHSSDSCCTATLSLFVSDVNHPHVGLDSVSVTVTSGHNTIASGHTDSNGNYSLNGLCGHLTYTISLSREGYHSNSITLSTDSCHEYQQSAALHPN